MAYFRMCGPLLLGIIGILIVSILYWLYFDLRQQMSDYRQKIEEVSAMSKNFPDTLQRWHETSSYLMKNQTAVIYEINELQKAVEGLRMNFSSLEAAANLSQLPMLHANELPTNLSDDIADLNRTTLNSLKMLSNDLKVVNNTLSQTTNMLGEEISLHKTKIDDLMDRSENVTSHVATISNSWPEYKQKVTNFDEALDKTEKEISLLTNKNTMLSAAVEQLKNFCIQRMDTNGEDASIIPKPDVKASGQEFINPSGNATVKLQESPTL
ncbi:GL10433 [Drosophila persimilis]|uniref:GL10433 n=1 Tax=Drosophila persimilis TaxID=7234 RepID=B4GCH5_DROPE|nr:GL10433 [Drosophila persimilis]